MKLVVWFPGLGSFANVTGNILRFFEKDPDTDVICLSYDTYGAGGYVEAAKRLSGPLESLVDAYDLVYFVGHSMGGDVAATLMTGHGFKPDKLVTIATPPGRIKYLPKSFGVLGDYASQCVLPEGPILRLYGGLDLLSNPKSPLFEIVDEPNTTRVAIKGHEHLSILWSSRAAAEVYSFCTYA